MYLFIVEAGIQVFPVVLKKKKLMNWNAFPKNFLKINRIVKRLKSTKYLGKAFRQIGWQFINLSDQDTLRTKP